MANKVYEPVKISDMSFKTQIVPGKVFKLTLSNATEEIRFKIPDSASVETVNSVSLAVKAFVDIYSDILVLYSMRGQIKISNDLIAIKVSTGNPNEDECESLTLKVMK